MKYGNVVQLGALAKLCGHDEGFDDRALVLEARRKLQKILEKAYKAVTYDVTTSLGCEFQEKGQYEKAKVFYLAALEGRSRVLGQEHKNTLASLNNIRALLSGIEDTKGR